MGNSPPSLPPNPFIARALSDCLTRAAIYFDGTLPPSKFQTRLWRLFEGSRQANEYFLATTSGIRPLPGHKIRNRYRDTWLPKPAFLVPTILESIRSLERYRNITHMVPGEADPYCAEDLRKNGGTLLTGDSDLVLYDLGPAGSVVFLHDLEIDKLPTDLTAVEVAERRRIITAMTYEQSEICRRLSLKPGHESMLSLGFEAKTGAVFTARSKLSQSNWQYLVPGRAAEYAQFISEYQNRPALEQSVPEYFKFLDPRVAEFIHDIATTPASKPLRDEDGKGPAVYLPLILDRWDLMSAWNPSMPVRQLAYNFCWGNEAARSAVVEYRRTLSKQSKGQVVEVLDGPGASEALEGILGFLGNFIDGTTGSSRSQWITVCLSLEIGYTASTDREPTALKLWQKAAKAAGRLDPSDWDAVHLVAHIQSTLYSFRMLQQVLKCRIGYLANSPALVRQVQSLEAYLSTLPPIAEYPCPPDMENLFAQLDQAGSLKALAEYTGISEPVSAGDSTEESRLRNKKQRNRDRRQEMRLGREPRKAPVKGSASANPFDVLGAA